MKSGFHLVLVFLFIGTVVIPMNAQQRFVIDHWQVENGLPTNSIRIITQTSDGYLWIGTNGGLSRFDGVRFTNFDISKTGVLRSNRIISLLEDRSKRLWIGTYGGGLCYYQNGAFHAFDLPHARSSFCSPYKLKEIPGVGLFIGTGELGLFVIQPSGKVLHFDQQNGLKSSAVNDILQTEEGGIYISNGKRLWQYRNGQITKTHLSIEQMNQLRFEYDPASRTIKGVYSTDEGNTARLVQLRRDTISVSESFRLNRKMYGINIIHQPQIGLVLLDHKGIYQLKYLSDRRVYLTPIVESQSSGIYQIVCFFADREGSYWIGTKASGIYRLKKNPFSHIQFQSGQVQNSTVSVIGNQSELYWCTPKVGIHKYHNGHITILPKTANFWTLSLFGDTLLASGYAEGLAKFYSSKRAQYLDVNHANAWGRSMISRNGQVWIGSYDGIAVFEGDKWIQSPLLSHFKNKRINRFVSTSDSTVYVCADQGIYRIHRSLDVDSILFPQPKALYHVRCAYELAPNVLLFGTYGNGLIIYNQGKTIELTEKSGLIDNTISDILRVNKHFWFTGNLGLTRIKEDELIAFISGKKTYVNATLYDQNDGLHVSEFNGGTQSSFTKLSGNTYAFNCINGLIVIDFDQIETNKHIPTIVIEKVQSENQLLSNKQSPVIDYANNRIEFEFTSLSLVSSKNNRFMYILKGYDSKWHEAGSERKAVYTNLPPGSYEFNVRGSNNDGVWNPTGASYAFQIRPPFYLTLWFRLVLVFLLSGLIGGIVWYIVYSIRKKERSRQELIQATQQARLNAIFETEEMERKRIAEDIHDGIGPLISTVKINLSLAEQQIDQHQRIQQAKDQLDQISEELRNITYNLAPNSLHAFGLETAVKEFVSKLSVDSRIHYYVECLGEIRLSLTNQTLLFRIIQEIINNAVKHSECSEITIQLIADDHLLAIMIEDNGKGFDYSNSLVRLESRGLKNIFERCAALSARIHLDTTIHRGTIYSIEINNER